MEISNPLHNEEYVNKIKEIKENTKLDEAVITGKIAINGQPAAVAVMDGRFMMASMGRIVGEKITKTVERATEENLPVIIFSCSGGARMQEGTVSLMQMAKTSAALKRHSDSGNLYISVLTNPTTGGVTASFAMLGDIIMAEKGALIGFAGPRVIEQTIGQKLPKGFQRSEFLLEHGFVDMILEREQMKEKLSEVISFHYGNKKEIAHAEIENSARDIKNGLSAWEKVNLIRDISRPSGEDYIQKLFDDFMEFHGDRYFGDDSAVMGGIAYFQGVPVTVIAQVKGHSTKENIEKNFGMSSPEGYRKALRLMKQAEKFHRPVITLINTAGAYCGIGAEERGQGEAIARNLMEMSRLKTPIISIFVGEGGSGGALALAVGDTVWMLEHGMYSVLSPEGFASILWRDPSRVDEAAELMRMTADHLLQNNVIDRKFTESPNGIEKDLPYTTDQIAKALAETLPKLQSTPVEELLEKRYQRFRQYGEFEQ